MVIKTYRKRGEAGIGNAKGGVYATDRIVLANQVFAPLTYTHARHGE